MADNRSASRQRRTNQNRAARESLATRRAAAAEKAAAQAKADAEADKAYEQAVKSLPKGQKASATSSRGSLKSRASVKPDVVEDDDVESSRPSRTSGRARTRPGPDDERPARPARGGRPSGPSPVPEHDPGIAGFFAGVREVPGGVAVMASVVLGLLAFLFFTFIFKFPQGPFVSMAYAAKGLGKPPQQTGAELGGPVGIVISLLPVLVSVVALAFALRPQRRKVWLICVFVTLALVTLGAGTAGLPCVIALGWGYWKTSKAERV